MAFDKNTGIGINDIKYAMETLYPGATTKVVLGIDAYTCTTTFDVYELRVILSGNRIGNPNRTCHIRFTQTVGRNKVTILNKTVTEPQDIKEALEYTVAYLRGIQYSIHTALTPRMGTPLTSIADLFRPNEDEA